MATAMQMPEGARDHTIRLEYGVPVTLCPKFLEGKNVESRYPGGRVMFTAIDERKMFLDDEDANDFERGMRELGIRPGCDFVRVTKVKHPRGGGHSIRVEAVDDGESSRPKPPSREGNRREAPPSRIEAQLAKSIDLARKHGPSAFISPAVQSGPAGTPIGPPDAPASSKGKMSALLAGALCASIDAYLISAEYAKSKGIPVELRLVIDAEDVRTSANSMLIEYWRSGGTR